jgi:D-aminopeptidase
VARTGVTAIVPPALPAPAGVAVLNGAGEMTGSLQVREWGCLETPVYLTATMAVGASMTARWPRRSRPTRAWATRTC